MLLIRTKPTGSGTYASRRGLVHILGDEHTATLWLTLCGRRTAKWRTGPFEQDVPDARPSHIGITCPKCRKLVAEQVAA